MSDKPPGFPVKFSQPTICGERWLETGSPFDDDDETMDFNHGDASEHVSPCCKVIEHGAQVPTLQD